MAGTRLKTAMVGGSIPSLSTTSALVRLSVAPSPREGWLQILPSSRTTATAVGVRPQGIPRQRGHPDAYNKREQAERDTTE